MSKIVEAYLREREVEANIVEERKRAMKIRAELQNRLTVVILFDDAIFRAASLHQNIDKERNENSSDMLVALTSFQNRHQLQRIEYGSRSRYWTEFDKFG